MNYIFIDRNNPKEAIDILIKQIKSTDNIFIFPEGTLFYKPMIEKSNDICKKLNIKNFKNVLCPKINGYNCINKILRPKYITDITLYYIWSTKSNFILEKSKIPLTIKQLIKNPPSKIIIIIQEKLANSNIVNIFREKDNEISEFIHNYNLSNKN
jgi:hypothetical protein